LADRQSTLAAAAAAAARPKNRLACLRCIVHGQSRGKVTGDYHYYPSASPIVSVCRASKRAIWTDRRCCCCGGGDGTVEKSLSVSSLQHTQAIARQGDQRLLAGHLAAPAAERDGRNVTRDTHCAGGVDRNFRLIESLPRRIF